MLAHILGRLPCPKKTPRKMWRSNASANFNYRVESLVESSPTVLRKSTRNIRTLFAQVNSVQMQNRQLHCVEPEKGNECFNGPPPAKKQEGKKNTFRLHRKPGCCAIRTWPDPVSALASPKCYGNTLCLKISPKGGISLPVNQNPKHEKYENIMIRRKIWERNSNTLTEMSQAYIT